MCNVLPFVELLKEVSFIYYIHLPTPEVFYMVFKENQICIAMAQSNRFLPRKKHVVIEYHRFRIFVLKKLIQICYIGAAEQTVYLFTKPPDGTLFLHP